MRFHDKTIILFGPPGIGKSTLIKRLNGWDLEQVHPDYPSADELAEYDLLGGAALDPRSLRDDDRFHTVLLYLPQEEYDERRHARDALEPAKAAQAYHQISDWNPQDFDEVLLADDTVANRVHQRRMAFLIPPLLAAGEALGTGALTALGGWIGSKIVGDGPADLDLMETIVSDLAAPANAALTLREDTDLQRALLDARLALQKSPPQDASRFRQSMSGLRLQLRNVRDPLYATENRVATQGASDAAALLVASPHMTQQAVTQQMQPIPPPHPAQQILSGLSSSLPSSSPLLRPSSHVAQLGSSGVMPVVENPYTAPQPPTKLLSNQTANIPPPTAQNSATGATIGQTLTGIATGALQSAGQAALEAAKDTATAALPGIKTAAKQAAGSLLNSAGQNLNNSGSGFLSGLKNVLGKMATAVAKKIVGDAPPAHLDMVSDRMLRSKEFFPMARDALRNVLGDEHPLNQKVVGDAYITEYERAGKLGKKVVGDAPPGLDGMDGMMTEEQVNAAVASMSESKTFTMFSLLIAEEQLFSSGSRFERIKAQDLWADIARESEPSDAAFRRADVGTVLTVAGMSGFPSARHWPMLRDFYQPINSQVNGQPNLSYPFDDLTQPRWRVGLKTADDAPPIVLSQTLQGMLPLAIGADLTQYSSSLKLTTPTLNYDIEARFLSTLTPYLSTAKGYSFALPLLKMMNYLHAGNVIPGDEMNQYTSGAYYRPAPDTWVDSRVRLPPFPLAVEEWANNPDPVNWNGSTGRMAVINDTVYMAVKCGLEPVHDWDVNFHPKNWGKTCSVIFIPREKQHDNTFVACCYLSQVAYPFSINERAFSSTSLDQNGGLFEFNRAGVPNNYITVSQRMSIEGPCWYHLFVVVGVGEEQVNVTIDAGFSLTMADHNPTTPTDVGGQGWLALATHIHAEILPTNNRPIQEEPIMAWIKWYETTFGNASDRSSALRVIANHDRLWASNTYIGNAQLPGQPYVTANWRSFGPANGLAGYEPGVIATVQENPFFLYDVRTPLFTRPNLFGFTDQVPFKPIRGPNEEVWPAVPYIYISRENHDVSLLCFQGHAAPLEEYPAHRVDSASSIAYSIAMMNTLMTGIADLGMQTNNMPIAGAYEPNIFGTSTDRMYFTQKRAFLGQILQYGIQYPQASFSDNATRIRPSILLADLYQVVFGNSIWQDLNVVNISRVPNQLLGTMLPSMVDNATGTTLAGPYTLPRRELLDVVPMDGQGGWAGGGVFVVNASSNEPATDKVIQQMFWPLSRGVFADAANPTSVNYGLMLVGKGRTRGARVLFTMMKPDFVWAAILSKTYRVADATLPPATVAFIPHGELPRRRMSENGWGETRLIMTGPKEMFNTTGTTTTAYDLFVLTRTVSQIHVTDTWHWQDNYPFQTGDLTNLFASF